MFFFAGLFNLLQRSRNGRLANLIFPHLCHFALGFISMSFDKILKLLPIPDFEVFGADLSEFGLDIPRFSLALAPQVNRIATDIKQLARLTFLETIHFDCLHHFLSEVVAIGFSHESRETRGIFLFYVLTNMNAAISPLN